MYLLLLILGLIVLLILTIAFQPATFRITRRATISAPPATVFGLINDFHEWAHWSPWAKLDPHMKLTFDGPPSGVGSIYHWEGDKKVGEGRMTLTDTRVPEFVRIRLEFLKPFQAVNTTEFLVQPEGAQTAVTWTMAGTHNFFSKAFALFMNMDRKVGGDFEKGLAQMKAVAEARVATR